MPDGPPNELKAALAQGRALIVCGAGVSLAATCGKAPGWAKLIKDGLAEATRLNNAAGKAWVKSCEALLASEDVEDWLNAANTVQAKLGGAAGGEYRGFLKNNLAKLQVAKPDILRAIERFAAAKNRIATTNYDHLISQAMRCDRVDWTNHVAVVEALRGERQAVWHIHGDYDDPKSVIFSKADYERIEKEDLPQFVQRTAALDFTLVFVGCSGSGLADDNVGELLKWLRKGFSGLGDKHFVLTDDKNADNWPKGLTLVRVGTHDDLPAYLEKLAPAPRVLATFPPDPKMIGREDRLKELVAAILDQDRPVLVPGALGMGKTTLALAAAFDPKVLAHFGRDRRFFVSLEPVPDADGIWPALATALGLDASGSIAALEQAIAEFCVSRLALVILDNTETPLRAGRPLTEAALGRLAAIERLRLMVTVRDEPPQIPGGGIVLRDVETLALDDARKLFLRHAGPNHASDPALPGLLQALDGHPLSIELLAANAAGQPNLTNLAADWEKRRAAILARGDGDTRLTSVRASLDLSLAALGAQSPAHRLLRLMALLPAGMAEGDCAPLLTDGAPVDAEHSAGRTLERARLASRRDGRWHLLSPVRETLRQNHPPDSRDKARLLKLFLARAALGERIGRADWEGVRETVSQEAGNFDAMIGLASEEAELPAGLNDAILGLSKLHRITGLASVSSMGGVAALLGKTGDLLGQANCIFSLGDIALARSDHASALAQFKAALPRYREVGSVLGEANCIRCLGEIALARSKYRPARSQFAAALLLYRKVGDVLGETNCIYRLGDVALERLEHAAAQLQYEAALPLYRKIGDVLGEANCNGRLGEIALARSDYASARARFEAGLPLYRKVGAVLGEAYCVKVLGDIALKRSDCGTARPQYEAALPLYRKVGDLLGEANCLRGLGDIEAFGDIAAARRLWNEALALYERIPEPNSIGDTYVRLMRHAATPAEAAAHREAAQRAWASIDRADLIAKHLDEAP